MKIVVLTSPRSNLCLLPKQLDYSLYDVAANRPLTSILESFIRLRPQGGIGCDNAIMESKCCFVVCFRFLVYMGSDLARSNL